MANLTGTNLNKIKTYTKYRIVSEPISHKQQKLFNRFHSPHDIEKRNGLL